MSSANKAYERSLQFAFPKEETKLLAQSKDVGGGIRFERRYLMSFQIMMQLSWFLSGWSVPAVSSLLHECSREV